MTPETDQPTDQLEVSGRGWLKWMWIPALFVVVALGLWWMGHPADLPTEDRVVSATTKAGQPVFLAVVGSEYDGRRNLEIDNVDLPISSADADGAEVEAWICKSGSIAQTSDPERFCQEVVEAEGSAFYLGGGDQLMIKVVAEGSGTVEIGTIRISFREGLQRGTLPAGPTYAVDVLE